MIALSIVTPTLGNPSRLGRLFASLATQDFAAPVEILLSTTNVKEQVIRAKLPKLGDNFYVSVIENTTPGIAAARNAAVRDARGEFVLFIDDDCILPDEKYLTLAFTLAKSSAKIGWAGSYTDNSTGLTFASSFYNYVSNLWLSSFNSHGQVSVILGGCAVFPRKELLTCHALFAENDEQAGEEFLFTESLSKSGITTFYHKDLSVGHDPHCDFGTLMKKSWNHGRARSTYTAPAEQKRFTAFTDDFRSAPLERIKFLPLLILFVTAGQCSHLWRKFVDTSFYLFSRKQIDQYSELRKPSLKRN